MFKKIISLFTVTSLFLTGCTKLDENTKKEMDKITVAEVAHSVFYAPQYVSITKGFFEEEGIEIDIVNTSGADKTMSALISNEAQIGLMGPEASIYVYNKGIDDYVVNFAQLTQTDGSFIIAREEMKDFSFEDLKGKEILGGRKGGVPFMTLEYVLKKNGLTIGENTENGEVNVRSDIQFGVMAGAFAAGEGDFTTGFEPTGTSMEKSKTGYVVKSIGEAVGEVPYTTYSVTSSFLKENKDLVQRFTNAIYKGQLWIKNATDKEVAEAMKPFFNDIPLEDLISIVKRYKSINAWCENPILTKEELNTLTNIMKEANELDKEAPFEKIVDNSFSENSIKNIKGE